MHIYIYICTYIHIYIYIYTHYNYIYSGFLGPASGRFTPVAHVRRKGGRDGQRIPASANAALLFCKPLPDNPAARKLSCVFVYVY